MNKNPLQIFYINIFNRFEALMKYLFSIEMLINMWKDGLTLVFYKNKLKMYIKWFKIENPRLEYNTIQ